ncbi:hypothetical protein [Streptomyces sp. NPDC059371]|uniref:hypothetical protein n=1 Tax=Streptomyces sp. NPDC059371 TaxID=3346812 RepID=UPI00368B3CFD
MSKWSSNPSKPSLPSREFLRHHERLLRPPLEKWTLRLHRELNGLNVASATEPEEFSSISSCLNKASFAVASARCFDKALQMCEYQLAWVAQRFTENSDARILGHAIQPWINIGRLHVLRGDLNEALPHFVLAEHLADLEPARLGPCFLSSDAWKTILAEGPSALPSILWNVYTLETLKGYLRVRDFAGLRSAISRSRRIVPTKSHGFITEGEILGLLHQGDAEKAVACAVDASFASPFDEAAYGLHEVTGLIMLGRTSEALHRAKGIVTFLSYVEPQRPKDSPTILRQLKQVSVLMEALGESQYALATILRGLDVCNDYEDEPLQFFFLSSALRLAPGHPESPNWVREYDSLGRHSLYAEVRSVREADSDLQGPSPVLDLFRAVEAVALDNEVGSPALHRSLAPFD